MEGQTIFVPHGNGSVSDLGDVPSSHPTPTTPGLKRAWWSRALPLVLAGLLGAVAGFGASSMHPGPQGKTGVAGASGVAGPVGPVGPAGAPGSAAQVSGLGVCYTPFSQNGWMTGIDISSPSKHADGTTYCANGTYVPVAPQAPPAAA
jgi:hypothetical protein